jgi:hypothetical protein
VVPVPVVEVHLGAPTTRSARHSGKEDTSTQDISATPYPTLGSTGIHLQVLPWSARIACWYVAQFRTLPAQHSLPS